MMKVKENKVVEFTKPEVPTISTMVITAKGVEYLRELFLDEAC